MKRRVLGIDFDNTIVRYDSLMHRIAVNKGLISADVPKSKREIRDQIRQLPAGEIEWQKLQALAYGPRIGEATMFQGARVFFRTCRERRVKVYIISHKTKYASFDETGTNLREAAVEWMRRRRFFSACGLGLLGEDVSFEETRQDKINRIRETACTHFIDDLLETFVEESFPADVEKILFSPDLAAPSLSGLTVLRTWREIWDLFFDGCS